jgi:hypothetical protein
MVTDEQTGCRGEAEQESRLWRDLQAMQIEPEGAALTFAARLARENGWSRGFAEQVFAEYKKFLYLAATAEAPVTPSEEVDEAWHLHLVYTRHYWDQLCGQLLKRPLHHGPTAGGGAEQARYRRQYEETLQRYREVFGTEPPPHIWPAAEIRFSGERRRIDASRYWLIPKARLRPAAGIAAAGTFLAACTAVGADGATNWLVVAAIVSLAAIILTAIARANSGAALYDPPRRRRDPDRGGDGGGYVPMSDSGGGSCKGSSSNSSSDCGDGGGDGGGGGCGGGCGS